MRGLTDRLIAELRSSGALPAHAGVEPRSDDESVMVEVPVETERRPLDAYTPSCIRGVRVQRSGQVSVWSSLPKDGMGGILNAKDLALRVAEALRLVGAVGTGEGGRLTIAVGVSGSMISVVDGSLNEMGRSSASFGFGREEPVRVVPDESVSMAALGRGSDELGRDLAAGIMDAFARQR